MTKLLKTTSSLLICLHLIFTAQWATAQESGFYSEELISTEQNSFYDIYDFILPALISAVTIKPTATDAQKIDRVADYVNFYSTPGFNKRMSGLGTNDGWRFGAAVMLYSGNILCSEQSALAVTILDYYFPLIRFRNVKSHTYHELFHGGRWLIVDPYTNMHLHDSKGRIASEKDIQDWLAGDNSALAAWDKNTIKTLKYLDLFKADFSETFGETYKMDNYSYDDFVGMNLDEFLRKTEVDKEYLKTRRSLLYLLYIRNNFHQYIIASDSPAQAAYDIQDYLFSKIREDRAKGITRKGINYDQLFARGYQLLGDYDRAITEYKKLAPSAETALFMAQCYFKQNRTEKFNSLRKKLRDNIFYRHMYLQLNHKELLDGDIKLFRKKLFL
ncbi:transglutaminase domain-containing protein [Desulfovibrio sp. JC010]|uniref:transglutaminase domain-containing protein n=1 Tax=Desulfovibrio sp. JC010 TaxID=2593641 RepID=UPI0013D37544|nr:transglutaminase domain-containing protein [Desulfovibrio sp. JC010]NDV25429.1 transglutaminase domain-containing protein [Desulfovibrio sp. JC010]